MPPSPNHSAPQCLTVLSVNKNVITFILDQYIRVAHPSLKCLQSKSGINLHLHKCLKLLRPDEALVEHHVRTIQPPISASM